eukprot:15361702-Ditylum_brightwellii.AAC.1
MKKYLCNYYSHEVALFIKYQDSVDYYDSICPPPIYAILLYGRDDKAVIQAGRTLPVVVIGKQSSHVMVAPDSHPVDVDHDWSCKSLIASVIHNMNLTEDPTDSLYSGVRM